MSFSPAVRIFPALLLLAFGLHGVAAPIDPDTGSAQPLVPGIATAGYQLAFSDEFNGTALDTGKWDYRTDSKMLSTQVPGNVGVSDGLLHLHLRKESAGGKAHTGGGVISRQLFRYGYYEARFRVPAGAGWHTSFWLQKHDGSGGTGTRLAAQGDRHLRADLAHAELLGGRH